MPRFSRINLARFAGIVLTGVLAADCARGIGITVGDDFTFGPDGYQHNIVEGGVSPSPRFELHGSWGTGHNPEPADYERAAWAVGGWMLLTNKLAVKADWSRYTGERVRAFRLPTEGLSGESGDRQVVETLGATVQADLVFPEDPGAANRGIRLDLGVAEARHRFPVWLEKWPVGGGGWERTLAEDRFEARDRIYSAGLRFIEGESTLDAVYSRHHYRFPAAPAGATSGIVRRIADSMPSSLKATVDGLPRYEVLLDLHHASAQGVSVDISYSRARIDSDYALVSTTYTGAGWMWSRQIGLRAGLSWVKAYEKTVNYKTVGATFYF